MTDSKALKDLSVQNTRMIDIIVSKGLVTVNRTRNITLQVQIGRHLVWEDMDIYSIVLFIINSYSNSRLLSLEFVEAYSRICPKRTYRI